MPEDSNIFAIVPAESKSPISRFSASTSAWSVLSSRTATFQRNSGSGLAVSTARTDPGCCLRYQPTYGPVAKPAATASLATASRMSSWLPNDAVLHVLELTDLGAARRNDEDVAAGHVWPGEPHWPLVLRR